MPVPMSSREKMDECQSDEADLGVRVGLGLGLGLGVVRWASA